MACFCSSVLNRSQGQNRHLTKSLELFEAAGNLQGGEGIDGDSSAMQERFNFIEKLVV